MGRGVSAEDFEKGSDDRGDSMMADDNYLGQFR